jgi:hypothetical protein
MLVAFHVLCIIWIAVLFWFYTQIAHLASVNSGSRPKLGNHSLKTAGMTDYVCTRRAAPADIPSRRA